MRSFGKGLALIAACGAYDVARNKKLDKSVIQRYFLGNGLATWILSPLNTLLDLLALPYVNKGVYKLDDLPADYQDEIRLLISASRKADLVGQLAETSRDRSRTMVFFKWYGDNVDTNLNVPEFKKDFKYIRTIGVSVFNKKQSTSKHFGPFRATLRVLYNLNDMTDRSAYIEVGDVKHYWADEKLFIFDDTLMHQSFNETDELRYCLFVDILRPSLLPAIFDSVLALVRSLLKSYNYVFYQHWEVVKG